MKRITGHLALAVGIKISNVWLFEDKLGHRFLIDCGHVLERPALRRALERAGVRRRGDLTAVLLTHRHSDHAGNAAWLRQTFDAPIIAHEADAAYLTGERTAPPLATPTKPLWARRICGLEDRYPARVPIDDVFTDGPWKHDLEIYHAPGHTEGSVMLHHGPTATLFSGDVLLAGLATLRPIERIRLADPNFSDDAAHCHACVREHLRRMPPSQVLASGHGPPVVDAVAAKLRALLGPEPR